jgi:transcriptional regulator with XRE-family HTH domain
MPRVPTVLPDCEKIRELIWQRGYSQADFARKIGRPPPSFWHVLNENPPRRVSVAYIKQIARGLRVRASDISDWAGDDDTESDAETKIPA